MNIYLLRHGQTEENRKGSYYGNLDISLNTIGISQRTPFDSAQDDISIPLRMAGPILDNLMLIEMLNSAQDDKL